ncbi:MFS transporter [Bacillus sp. SRB_336]|nr:MFS transporter [Bacillus sp. SRB_336]
MSTTIDHVRALTPEQKDKEVRRVLGSSFLGSVIEYYDFFLYASAASLVFAPVFFSNLNPLAGTIASLATFAAGYVARPVGGLIFGHFGDRLGRKKMLILSMTGMGIGSFLIALIPPAAAIGSWGAVMLVTLRILQGIAVGGEWGGAALMSLEHAKTKSRGFAASFASAGGPAGIFLATGALGLAALLPHDAFLAWGWRIPFLASAALLVVGLAVRAKVSESPVFKASMTMQEENQKESAPIVEVLRRPKVLILTTLSCIALFSISSMASTFGVTYAVGGGARSSSVLFALSFTELFTVAVTLVSARLSDTLGRRWLMIGGGIAFALAAYPLFAAMGSGSIVLVFIAFTIFKVCFATIYGPMAAFVSEQHPARSRYTGASLSYQLASLIGAGFTPIILASIYAASGRDVAPVIWFLIGMCVISAVAIFLTRESKDNDLISGAAVEDLATNP